MNEKIYSLDEIKSISGDVFKKYPRIKTAYLFGSYARSQHTAKSDLDFMIVLYKYDVESLKDELRVEDDLMTAFNKNVDTLNEKEAMKIMPKSIERDKVLIYERQH